MHLKLLARDLRAGEGLETNNINSVGANNVNIQRGGTTLITFNSSNQIQLSGDLLVNTVNGNGDNDLIFQRDGIQYLALDKLTKDTVEKEATICSNQYERMLIY